MRLLSATRNLFIGGLIVGIIALLVACQAPSFGTPPAHSVGMASATQSASPGIPSDMLSDSQAAVEEPFLMATKVFTTTPSAIDTTGWTEHHLSDVGTQLLLPADWTILLIDLVSYYARPAQVQSLIDPAAFALGVGIQLDASYDLAQLTETQAFSMAENEPGPLVHYPTSLGGYQGVKFLGFANLCMRIFVPAYDVVHVVSVSSYLCEGGPANRSLKPEAQAMLDSIRFFPADPPPPDGLPLPYP